MNENVDCGIKFSVRLLHPRYWIVWLGFLLVFFVAQLPNSARHFIGRRIGNRIYKNNQKRHDVVMCNIKICFPDLSETQQEEMTQKHLQWYGCALVDYSILFFGSKRRLASMIVIEGQEHIDNAIENNKSIIILLAHSVMLEFAPVALGSKYDVFGSYKTSKNALLDWIISRSRCRYVRFTVSREDGLRKLIKSLIPRRIMVFLPDEDLGIDNSTFALFFGEPKATLTTTARLTKMGKATALPTFSWYDGDTKKYKIQISPPLENYPSSNAEESARILNQSFEQLIKSHPHQYMWTLKLFKTRPDNEAMLY